MRLPPSYTLAQAREIAKQHSLGVLGVSGKVFARCLPRFSVRQRICKSIWTGIASVAFVSSSANTGTLVILALGRYKY
jgi:hypothetical protein